MITKISKPLKLLISLFIAFFLIVGSTISVNAEFLPIYTIDPGAVMYSFLVNQIGYHHNKEYLHTINDSYYYQPDTVIYYLFYTASNMPSDNTILFNNYGINVYSYLGSNDIRIEPYSTSSNNIWYYSTWNHKWQHEYTGDSYGGKTRVTFKLDLNGTYKWKFNRGQSSTLSIIPLGIWSDGSIDDNGRALIGMETSSVLLEETNKLLASISKGTPESDKVIDANDKLTNDLNSNYDKLNSSSKGFTDDFSKNIDAIKPSTADFSKLSASANWVKNTFDNIVMSNSNFNLLLMISLTVGIALLLLGKVR